MRNYIAIIILIGVLLIPGTILAAQTANTNTLTSVRFLTSFQTPLTMGLSFDRGLQARDIDIKQLSYPARFVVTVSDCKMSDAMSEGVIYQDILSDGRHGVRFVETYYDITHEKISFIAHPLDGLDVRVYEPEPGVVLVTFTGVPFDESSMKNLIDMKYVPEYLSDTNGPGFEDYLRLDQAKLYLSAESEEVIRNYFSKKDEGDESVESAETDDPDEADESVDEATLELDDATFDLGTGYYKIQVGDKLALGVAGEPETEVSATVRPDGYVSFPIIGDILVAGKTADEVRSNMKEMLQPYYSYEIIFDVLIMEFIPQKVYLLGKVYDAGSQLYVPGMTILDTLSNFDHRESDLTAVKLIRKDQVLNVDLTALFAGDTSLNYVLEPGDYIVIPAMVPPKATVLGRVRIPGDYEFVEGDKLFDLIGYANGFEERCDIKKILVMRLGENGLIEYNFCNLLAYREEAAIDQNIFIKDGDIIMIPEVGRPNWDKFFKALGTFNSLSYWARVN